MWTATLAGFALINLGCGNPTVALCLGIAAGVNALLNAFFSNDE